MCFSAPASFTASAVLSIIGAILIYKTKTKRFYPLAVIPFGFAIQQAAEGFVWLDLSEPTFAKNIFLFFAYSFWPIWIPFSLWIVEKDPRREKAILFFCGMGLVAGLFWTSMMPEITPVYYRCCIRYIYSSNTSLFTLFAMGSSFSVALLSPFFISSLKMSKAIGIFSLIGAVVIELIDVNLFTSVWCFYIALISISLFWLVKKNEYPS